MVTLDLYTTMHTTLNLDDDLLAEAERLTGTSEKTACRLAALGGTAPDLSPIHRRRGEIT